ncbi:hypothetical protein TNCV_2905721 [Trichonephila clavipes]|nr:hypothetical protein TNCV_2241651 [Trichonephila clavipes]GFT38370.1 hypothetical protein TNCV_3064251 [Trichonephila clavipes]GFU06542.1 hypothetical protein TNCV_1718541 [Trichonephila clavipes]GFU33693.1 hypothetical protein TNCV_2905721 [Trichonephila clavipes]
MPSFHDPLRLFLFANNQIGDPWKKRTWHLSDSRAYRQYEAEDKRLFRDAIQLAIIDAKTPTTVFFFLRAQWVMTKDFQRVGRYLHQAFSEPLHE